MRNMLLLGSLVLLGSFAAPSGADEVDLNSLNLGQTVWGPVVTLDDCRGKVTLVEFWGTH